MVSLRDFIIGVRKVLPDEVERALSILSEEAEAYRWDGFDGYLMLSMSILSDIEESLNLNDIRLLLNNISDLIASLYILTQRLRVYESDIKYSYIMFYRWQVIYYYVYNVRPIGFNPDDPSSDAEMGSFIYEVCEADKKYLSNFLPK